MRTRLPNVLSVSRIVIGIVVALLPIQLSVRVYFATLCFAVLALFSDGLDGYLARRWNTATKLGYVLDSLGDRAVHLSFFLVFFLRYQIHPIIIWLLIFRDIGVFAIRLLRNDWLRKSKQLQWISRLHATILRIWLGLFVMRDGFRVFTQSDVLATVTFERTQVIIACITIVISYYGLIQALKDWPQGGNQTL